MAQEKVDLGRGSSVRFVELDGCFMDKESILRTINSYENEGMWPSDFSTSIFSFKDASSLIKVLRDEGIDDTYTIQNLADVRCTCHVEEKRALVSLPQILRYDSFNEQNHELTHVPQRLREKDGGIFNIAITPLGNPRCPKYSLSGMSQAFDYLRFMWDDFIANSLFPGDKKSLVPSADSLINMANTLIPELDKILPFCDTFIACDVCKIYPIDYKEGEMIIENLKIDDKRKGKLKGYISDLCYSMKKSFENHTIPTKEKYCDGLMELVRVVNVYESSRLCEHGDNFVIFVVPTLTFRKLDGSYYTINTQDYQEIPSMFSVSKDQIRSMVEKRMGKSTQFYMNKRCF